MDDFKDLLFFQNVLKDTISSPLYIFDVQGQSRTKRRVCISLNSCRKSSITKVQSQSFSFSTFNSSLLFYFCSIFVTETLSRNLFYLFSFCSWNLDFNSNRQTHMSPVLVQSYRTTLNRQDLILMALILIFVNYVSNLSLPTSSGSPNWELIPFD